MEKNRMNFKKFYSLGYIIEEDTFSDWNEYVNSKPILKSACEVIDKITKAYPNSKSYIVGGAVRDIILGEDFDDIDIATNVPIDKIEKIFPSHDIGKNKEFGIIVVNHNGFDFEIANFRQDGTYSDGRRPDTIKIVPDFKDDAARRDFTINAMAIDRYGNIIDYFDGKKDIKNKIIRTVGNPEEKFTEDYIRLLRAIRFASRMGFNIEEETWKALQSKSDRIKGQAAERIMKEVLKMARQSGAKFASAIVMMHDAGLLKYIFPEVDIMKDFLHSPEHHPEGGVFDHTIAALKAYKGNDPVVNLSILLHDVGKPLTYALSDKGIHTYYNHDNKAKEVIEKIAERLKLPNAMKDAIIFAATNHMNYFNIPKMSNNKIVQLLQSPYFNILEQTALADAKARGNLFDQNEWNEIQNKINKVREKYKSDNIIKEIKKTINGNFVMSLTGLKPSKQLGEIINKTVEYIIDNELDVVNDIEEIKKFIKDQVK